MAAHSSEKMTFPGAHGHDLAARLDLPIGPPKAYALFAHCFTCSKDIFAASRIADGLTQNGIAVLRFDFTGLGASEGDFANTNFSSNVDDLVAAADFLRANHQAPQIIIGHSLGGAAVLVAAKHIQELKAVVTVNAPADPAHVIENFQCSLDDIKANGQADVQLAGRTFTIQKQFLEDMEEQKLSADIANLNKALLVFHAPGDETVSVDNAAHIFGAAKHPKSFVSLDNADHLLHHHEDAAYVADVISAWATRYISVPSASVAKGEKGAVVVQESHAGMYTQSVVMNNLHILTADEPLGVGGNDSGGAPYDYLLAALGACTSMTLRMYANRKKLPLDNVHVSLKHEKGEGRVDFIERDITLKGALSDEQRTRLMEIADKCPVHRTLHGEVQVTTRER
ncbi:MAG: osmotically inducible protein C [Rhodospirillaceae bacterium]|nr:MAG: osmotically inducible protein C [Rhodospirillaceae bacterium]